jgi:GNAT superfamily N-acetyltransferase
MTQFDPSMVAQMLMQPIQRASENLGGGPFGIGADAGGSYFVDPEVAARTGYGTAVTGTSFFPGAGIVDAYGGAVDVTGQPLPSFSENIREGQFTDAGLQALGVAGDIATIAAPLTGGATALLGAMMKAPGAARKFSTASDIVKDFKEAPSVFGEGARQVDFIDQETGSKLSVIERNDETSSVIDLFVPEEHRGKGIGFKLQQQAMNEIPNLMGQVSSKAAAVNAYRLGRRPAVNPDATLEETLALIDQDSSVNMLSPVALEKRTDVADSLKSGSSLFRYERKDIKSPDTGAVFYSPDKSYAELYKSEDSVLRETKIPENFLDIQKSEDQGKAISWISTELDRVEKLSDNAEISGVRSDINLARQQIANGDAQGISSALANLNLIYGKENNAASTVGMAEKKLMQGLNVDAMSIKEAGRNVDEFSIAFKNNPDVASDASKAERKARIAANRREANILRFGYDPNDPETLPDTSYRIQHQARGPNEENPVRLDDMTKSTTGEEAGYPDDFYSSEGQRLYAQGARNANDGYGMANTESYNIIQSVKGNPDAEVIIYRGVPDEDSITDINTGDFVTLSKKYAELHAASGYGRSGDEAGKIISKKVKVKDIYWDQNDVNEFGYFPDSD